MTFGVAAAAVVTVAPPLLAACGIFDCYTARRQLRDRTTRAARRLARGGASAPVTLPGALSSETRTVLPPPPVSAPTSLVPSVGLAAESVARASASSPGADGPTDARGMRMTDAIREAVREFEECIRAGRIKPEDLQRAEEDLAPYLCEQSESIPIEPVRNLL